MPHTHNQAAAGPTLSAFGWIGAPSSRRTQVICRTPGTSAMASALNLQLITETREAFAVASFENCHTRAVVHLTHDLIERVRFFRVPTNRRAEHRALRSMLRHRATTHTNEAGLMRRANVVAHSE